MISISILLSYHSVADEHILIWPKRNVSDSNTKNVQGQ